MTENEVANGENDRGTEQRELPHEKRLHCLELRKAGCSYEEIAKAVGCKSRRGAFKAVARLLETMAEEPLDFVRKIELERLNSLMAAIWQKAKQGDLDAIDRALAIHQRICTLTGIEGVVARQLDMAPHVDTADRLVKELMDETPSAAEPGKNCPSARTQPAPAKPAPPKTAAARAVLPANPAAPLPKTKPKEAGDEAVPYVSPKYWITLSALVLVLAVFWGMPARGNPSPAQLAQTALTDADKTHRIDAAAALTMVKQPDPTELLRQVAGTTSDPEVLIQTLNGLNVRGDQSSLPLFFGALEHADSMVRAAAWTGVLQFYNGAIPEGLAYNPDGPAEERMHVARRLKQIREELLAKVPKDARP